MNQIQQLQSMIDQSSSIVFFGGAGVSTESGIPDFRSVDGLYNQQYDYPPEEILSHRFFLNHTKEFYTFYQKKLLLCDHPFMPQPNAAHYKLAQLEQAGRLRAVITQNIDGLHQKAGSKHVLELTARWSGTTAWTAAGHILRITFAEAQASPVAAVAASSSRMWYCMRNPWTVM